MRTAGRWALLVAAGLLLSGCRFYSLTDRIENARAPRTVEKPARYDATMRSPALKKRARRGRTVAAEQRGERRIFLYPQTPYVGSPEFERERIQNERRERELARSIGAICRGC